jgi:hypothetical protein
MHISDRFQDIQLHLLATLLKLLEIQENMDLQTYRPLLISKQTKLPSPSERAVGFLFLSSTT